MKRSPLYVRIKILYLLIIAIFSNIDLYDDGLHLLELGRCILANNVSDRINNFLLTHLHHLHRTYTQWSDK